jgi:glycosyltransferase involved in cell wall biosynthesis
MNRIGVAAVGNVLDINCWSNIPYFFYKAGNSAGFLNLPWQADTSKFKLNRIYWNLFNVLIGRGKGGFQYSNCFEKLIEKQIPEDNFKHTVISFSQSFPRSKKVSEHGGGVYYYIDATLNDLFREKEYDLDVPNWIKIKAIEREIQNYFYATKIAVMGNWVKESLIAHYKVPDEKIVQILPGANFDLPTDWQPKPFVPGAGISRPLVLGFIGKDWERKGLPLLIEIKNMLQSKGYIISIKAIGNCPDKLKKEQGLEYTGFVNKQTDTDKFIEIISSCDIGCLFSSSEALGISTLEFLRVGVPVAGYYHQGLKDTLLEGASFRFALEDSIADIACRIEAFILNENEQMAMRNKAWEYSPYVSWDRCVNEWKELLEQYE